ncbi:clathrin coat assembly protein AP180-like [Pleurodeles waltl]|uniref:clathrin coat assembly protein AP180-like n=1 Tax=Pleurodeles waltl TaxID=8319 RepID=UPI00370999C4
MICPCFLKDDFSSASHGVSPLAESSLTADLLSVDAFAAPPPVPTASPAKVDSSAVIDLFGDAFGGCTTEPQSTAQAVSSSSASADLLAGFGGSFMAPSAAPITPAQNNVLQTNFYAAFGATPATGGSSFDPSGFDGLGDLLMPMVPAAQSSGSPISMSMNASGSSKVLGGDLDSSLAKLVGILKETKKNAASKPATNHSKGLFAIVKEFTNPASTENITPSQKLCNSLADFFHNKISDNPLPQIASTSSHAQTPTPNNSSPIGNSSTHKTLSPS